MEPVWYQRATTSVTIGRGLLLLLVGLALAMPAAIRLAPVPVPLHCEACSLPDRAGPPEREPTTVEVALVVIGLTTAVIGLGTAIVGLVTVIKSRPETTQAASTTNLAVPAKLDHESDDDWRSADAYN